MDFNLDIVLFLILWTSSYADALNHPTVVYISPQQTEIHPALRPQVFHSAAFLLLLPLLFPCTKIGSTLHLHRRRRITHTYCICLKLHLMTYKKTKLRPHIKLDLIIESAYFYYALRALVTVYHFILLPCLSIIIVSRCFVSDKNHRYVPK